ncbi:MAG: hypothetical protein CMB99_10805 [Flavobacteriaceae bacterium]|nr:hypothetical protein [Flavobacteriaceae bacterium]|tara:strand:- start:166871 stop:168163 length:1293 start_codon:yes stop_codon:yes gene_type:complete
MEYVVSILFTVEFFLILLVMLFLLFKEGLSFKVGIAFATLYFIFIPVMIMVFTGTLELSKADFGMTKLGDVVLIDNLYESYLLLIFVFTIILYLYFPMIKGKSEIITSFQPKTKYYLTIYLVGMTFIFLGSGLLKGGNWYDNRHDFFASIGPLALLIAFVLNSSKILIIGSMVFNWLQKKVEFVPFIILLLTFTVIDMIFSGNRIYLFCAFALIALILLRKYPVKTFLLTPVILPLVAVLGYLASIFKHMRGPLFYKGIPTVDIFISSFIRAVGLEPPSISAFFLGISESVNVNVIYKVFENYNDFLYGLTFLKPFFFYLPRSIWSSKPESITIIAANTYGGASMVTTIIGEMYMNFYLFGILILPVFLWLLDNSLSLFLRKYGDFAKVILFIFGLLIFRMPFSDELLVFVFLILILAMFSRFKAIKFKF